MAVFLERARTLKAQNFLFQTPPSFKPARENLEAMEGFFKSYQGKGLFLWEPRGEKWTPQIVKECCQGLGLVHATDPLLESTQVWGDFTYFRLHGNLRTYHHNYSREEMAVILELSGEKGYIMFNNDKMWKNASEMKILLET
jgi:uncharacterized protein YecE (DUF72 family)